MAVRTKARKKMGTKAAKKPARKAVKNAANRNKKKTTKKVKKKTTKKGVKASSRSPARRAVKRAGQPVTSRGTTKATPASPTSSAGVGDEAVLKATGKRWSEWLSLLDKAGAVAWTHRRIALHLHEHCGVSDWWCQMVAVGYEQARGLREKYQKTTGYSASASKTFDQPLAEIYERWADEKKRRRWLDARGYFIRKANENKSLRITWEDGTSVEVYFLAKGPGRTMVQVQQNKLPDAAAVERAKAFWKAQFAALERGV